ncbi:T9SS type A sorting domain-containing protein [candidate division GN15 bacterium]|nr:T9SS type A sorting domain-containing protein [candidate division GN15 bacterium]
MSFGTGVFSVLIALCLLAIAGAVQAVPVTPDKAASVTGINVTTAGTLENPYAMFPVVIRQYEWSGLDWQLTQRSTATRDAQDRVTGVLIEEWDFLQQVWLSRNLIELTYSAGDTPDTITTSYWTGVWEPLTRTIYFYDGQGRAITELIESNTRGGWTNLTRTTWSYDGNGKIDTELEEYWLNLTWNNSFLREYTYSNGLVSEILENGWFGMWSPNQRYVYTYSGSDETEELVQGWSGLDWFDSERYLTTYSGGLPADYTSQFFSTSWQNSSREVYDSYDTQERLLVMTSQGWTGSSWIDQDRFEYEWDALTSVDESGMSSLPSGFALKQNYPNPFNPSTVIEFTLPAKSQVSVSVYDILGRRVADLFAGELAAGDHMVEWDGSDRDGVAAASGVYLYRIQAGAESLSRKMLLVK